MNLPRSAVSQVVSDLERAELGDTRRNKRMLQLVASLARSPSASLPRAVGNEAAIEGAYRFVNNRQVSFEDLVAPHAEATKERAEQAGDVLILHDTTDASFPDLDPREIGYLQTGKAGFRIHLSLVVDAQHAEAWRRPLGVIHAETLHRAKRSKARGKRPSGPDTAAWRDRESERWWRGMEAAGTALGGCERAVHVADREADSYALMGRLTDAGQRFVIRARQGHRRAKSGDAVWSSVKEIAAACEGILERDVPLSRRKAGGAPQKRRTHPNRRARTARLQFSATHVEIPRPQYEKDPMPRIIGLNLIHVSEADPPDNERGVEWLLLTTESIASADDVARIVDMYRTRWLIEEFNQALKTGCAYEARQFESKHALLAMLALSLPIACEVLWLRSRARSHPEAPATDVLSEVQLQILRALGTRKLSDQPTAHEALMALAGLGGHLRTNGPPGWKILKRSMETLLAYEAGWCARGALEKM